MNEKILKQAATLIAQADSILIAAGAGMGVDSGLPDFRGNEGFWQAYPPLRHLQLSFVEMANPGWFDRDPSLAWGFYGHRLNLYRDTLPHDGFRILRHWMERIGSGFIFTSNVDGHFQKTGFPAERIVECHGSVHHLQCTVPCSDAIWSAAGITVAVDLQSFRAAEPLPVCAHCGALARPNVLMFGDWRWCEQRTARQEARFRDWLDSAKTTRMVVVECGAGSAVPTVRHTCEQVASRYGASILRVNRREPQGPAGTLPIAAGALEALMAIDKILEV